MKLLGQRSTLTGSVVKVLLMSLAFSFAKPTINASAFKLMHTTTDVLPTRTRTIQIPRQIFPLRPKTVARIPRSNTTPSPKKLSRESTAADVLQALATSNKFAPYVGPHGVAVITGGSSGIGVPTVEALANAGMRVVLCARDPCLAKKVMGNMRVPKNSAIRVQPLDLADLNSIQRAVDEIRATEGNIDLLLNNAGLNSVPSRQVTAQGLELQFGVNHVGHFFLTRLLLPYTKSGGRVVTVSSKAHSSIRKMRLHDLNMEQIRYHPWFSYSQSKLANVLFAKGLQDRLQSERLKIMSLCLHPGIVMTDHWQNNDLALLDKVSEYMMTKTADQGAATNVFCSLADDSHFDGGDYMVDCGKSEPNDNAQDKTLREELWDRTEEMIESVGFKFPKTLVKDF